MKVKEKYGKEMNYVELKDVLNAEVLESPHVIEDWPYGRSKRCKMTFSVESDKSGRKQRFVKQSEFNGRLNKPKKSTYANQVFLIMIDGNIGRVELSRYAMATVRLENSIYPDVTFHDDEWASIFKHFNKNE